MSYWDEVNDHKEKIHKRDIEYENLRHRHRMKEMKYRVYLFEKYEKEVI